MKIAIYMRISQKEKILTEKKEESNSISNQRNLLRNYIKSLNLNTSEITEYIDD